MTITDTSSTAGLVRAGDVDLWVEHRGTGPDVLLLVGLTDTVEAWQPQLEGLADRYTLTTFDTRGAGRSPMIPADFTVADLADDAAAVLRALDIESAHVAGFSGGSATAQELALRHPELVRSLVLQSTWGRTGVHLRQFADTVLWTMAAAPSERAAIEAFFLWVYTARSHEDGTVAQIIEEALAFEHPQAPEAFVRQLECWMGHDTLDRLDRIAVPTLVLMGGRDPMIPPESGRAVAERIAGAELRILEGESHQPFQEVPAEWNAIVDEFWSRVDAGT